MNKLAVLLIITVLLLTVALTVVLALPSTAKELLTNPGFEEVGQDNNVPNWSPAGNMQLSFRSETTNPHSGERCTVIENKTNREPWLFAFINQTVPVLPGVRYELSCWVRGDGVSKCASLSDRYSWGVEVPSGTFGWKQLKGTFRTKNEQTSAAVSMNVYGKCKELAIDDVSFRAVGDPISGQGITGSYIVPRVVYSDDIPLPLTVDIKSSLKAPATFTAVVKAGPQVVFKREAVVKPGDNTFGWEINSGKVIERKLQLSFKVSGANAKPIASASCLIEKSSPSIALAGIERVEARIPEFERLYDKCKAKGIPLGRVTATKTMLGQFIPFAREDLQKNETLRADYAARDFERSLDDAITWMNYYLEHPDLVPNIKRYRTGNVDIDGISFIGDRKDSKGKADRGPVFYCGYGHFSRVRADIPLFQDYGVNIIQTEFGPHHVLTSENDINLDGVKSLAETLDNAAKNNVMVNVLLSPHYFPQWAYAKWPHIRKGGYFFCNDSPEVKYVLGTFLRTVALALKDKPALHSFCLTNEPRLGNIAGCDGVKEKWADYLTQTHGDVQLLNARYGTSYKSMAEVPVPGNHDYAAPQFYDWIVFNQQYLAEWHKWMADVIHEVAPNVPVHTKIMGLLALDHSAAAWAVDPEMFGQISQINGNDCASWPGSSGWGISWHEQNAWYDLQRSFAYKPIFNSENHISGDGSTYYMPPENFRTALWQGAIHGQGATTIWVWERTFDRGYPFYGNVMHRPGCAEAVGLTCLDLNTYADEVTALQKVKAPVAVLFSMTSMIRKEEHYEAVRKVYDALNFCGIKIDFISEKQLVAGKGKEYKAIFIPEASHVPASVLQVLHELPNNTRVILAGNSLTMDQYGNAHPAKDVDALKSSSVELPVSDAEKLWPIIMKELDTLNVLPEVSVVDAKTGKPVWGVEWLPVQLKGRTVVNIVNLTDEPVTVKLTVKGKEAIARDLLSLGKQEKVKTLKPITPVLAEITP